MKLSPTLIRQLAIAGAVLAFFLLVWPGLYAYNHVAGVITRTNKITGVTEVSSGAGWKSLR